MNFLQVSSSIRGFLALLNLLSYICDVLVLQITMTTLDQLALQKSYKKKHFSMFTSSPFLDVQHFTLDYWKLQLRSRLLYISLRLLLIRGQPILLEKPIYN